MYPIGSILLAKNYKLPTAVKDKFFIVIATQEGYMSLLSMTTSKIYFDTSLVKHGIIRDRDVSVYCFKSGIVIGQNGFSFRKDTIVSHRSNIHQVSEEKLRIMDIEVMDFMIKDELINLIYSFYKYKYIDDKYKTILEDVLNNLCNSED